MNQPSPPPSPATLIWQPERRLQSQDRLWILTDVCSEWRQYQEGATPQLFYRVGCYDLRTQKIGYVRFTVDDATGFLRAGLPPPPWPTGLPQVVEVKRLAHSGGQEKGRFKVEITLIDIEPDMAWIAPAARTIFKRDGHFATSTRDMWKKMVDRVAQEKAIEAAALAMVGLFAAGDVRKALGKDVSVSRVLRRLVEEKRLLMFGKKRGTKYLVI